MIIQKFIVMSQKDGCLHGTKSTILFITYFIYQFQNQYWSSIHSSPLLLRHHCATLVGKFHKSIQFARIHTSSLISIENTLNIPITKFYNVADVHVIAAELRLTKTGTKFFYKKKCQFNVKKKFL